MRASKALHEQRAAQYLITTLCVWNVEQRWDADRQLMYAWDLYRFEDPYRRVLLPHYPRTRAGVCAALSMQFGTPVEDLTAAVAEGTVFPDYAKPWEVAIASLGKLITMVRQGGHGGRLWEIAEGRLDLQRAYRTASADDFATRTADAARLRTLAAAIHPEALVQWMTLQAGLMLTHSRLASEPSGVTGRGYRLLREIWKIMGLMGGEPEQEAFLAFLADNVPQEQVSRAWERQAWGWGSDSATVPPDCLRQLGLPWPCTEADVTQAYRRLAHTAHPDRGGSAEAFHRLTQAYERALAWVEQHQRETPGGHAA